MKLLQKKEIDQTKAKERKMEVDEGIFLAEKVDALRRTKAEEEKNLLEFRNGTVKKIQQEIDNLIYTRDSIEKQCEEATKLRETLLTPDILKVKQELKSLINSEAEKMTNYLSKESLLEEVSKLEMQKKEIDKSRQETIKIQKEILKLKNETELLRLAIKEELRETEVERQEFLASQEKELLELATLKDSYENGIAITKREEDRVREKELDLEVREKHLASQQIALKIALDEVKRRQNY